MPPISGEALSTSSPQNAAQLDAAAHGVGWYACLNRRLILSIGVVGLAALLAGGIGLLTYERIDSAFRDVSGKKIPAMALALQMVEQTRALSSDALTLAAASNPAQHAAATDLIAAHKDQMRGLLESLSNSALMSAQIRPIETLVRDLFGALSGLEGRVERRLKLIEQRRHAVRQTSLAHGRLIDWLTPRIDDANFDLVIQAEDTTNRLSNQIETLMTDGVSSLQAALKLRAAVNLLTGIMIEAAVASNRGVLEAAADRFTATKAAAEEQLVTLAEHPSFRTLEQDLATLYRLADGPSGVFAMRRKSFGNLSLGLTHHPDVDPTKLAKEIYRPRESILTALEPIIDDASFDLIILSESAVDDSSRTINNLIDQSVDALRAYLNIAAEANWLAGLLRQTSMERDAAILGSFAEQINAATAHLLQYQGALGITDPPRTELARLVQSLFARATGPEGITELRAVEINVEKRQQADVLLTHDLAAMLTQAVNDLVETTRADVAASSQSVEEAILQGRWLVAGLSASVLLIATVIFIREGASRRKLERSARELQDHHDRLQQLVEERTRTVSDQAEELRKALEAEKELSGLQRQFVSMVCHEFRTPLAIIDGNAQRLIRRHEKISSDRQKNGLSKIRTSVIRLTDLMESVLSAARLEAGSIRYEPEPCSLAAVIEEVSGNHQEVNPGWNIATDLEKLPDVFSVDAKLIRQVISNLISNAIKYSSEGAHVWVKGTSSEDGGVRISVRDEGVGIPADELEKLFDRFFRASTSMGIAGTGIGLHMVKTLVDMHGGTVNVASTLGEGTTFTVYLPRSCNRETSIEAAAAGSVVA